MKKKYLVAMLLFTFLCLPFPSVQAAQKPHLTKTKLTIGVGETVKVKLKGSSKKVKWSIKKQHLARISDKKKEEKKVSSCKITGRKPGKTVLTAVAGKKKYTCTIQIERRIYRNKKIVISKGNQKRLLIDTSCKITWLSSNKKVAQVSSYGIVKGKRSGKATITAVIGNQKIKFPVEVKNKIADTKKFQYKVRKGQATITKYTGDDDIVVIPKKLGNAVVTRLDQWAFGLGIEFPSAKQMVTISEVKLPGTIVSIGKETFEGCCYLQKIKLSSSLNSIGEGAFMNTVRLKEIHLPDSLNSLGESAFLNSGIRRITLPANIKVLRESTFGNCSQLSSIRFSKNLETISEFALSNLTKLKEIVIPDSVKQICANAFAGCDQLERCVIQGVDTQVNSRAFGTPLPERLTVYGRPGSNADNTCKKYHTHLKNYKECYFCYKYNR